MLLFPGEFPLDPITFPLDTRPVSKGSERSFRYRRSTRLASAFASSYPWPAAIRREWGSGDTLRSLPSNSKLQLNSCILAKRRAVFQGVMRWYNEERLHSPSTLLGAVSPSNRALHFLRPVDYYRGEPICPTGPEIFQR